MTKTKKVALMLSVLPAHLDKQSTATGGPPGGALGGHGGRDSGGGHLDCEC